MTIQNIAPPHIRFPHAVQGGAQKIQITGTTDCEDAFISDWNPTRNYGGATYLTVGESTTGKRRVLMRFDLSEVPLGATIISSKLKLYHTTNNASNTRTIRVYRVKRAWTEGTGDHTPNDGTMVDWDEYDGTNPWSTAGCGDSNDRETTEIGSLSLASDLPTSTWIIIPLTASVKTDLDWGVENSVSETGYLLKMDTESDDEHVFSSSEGSNPPVLEIVFTS